MCCSISENTSPSLVALKSLFCWCLAATIGVASVGVRVARGQGLGDLCSVSWGVCVDRCGGC